MPAELSAGLHEAEGVRVAMAELSADLEGDLVGRRLDEAGETDEHAPAACATAARAARLVRVPVAQ
jgi:hypothetical protein